MKHRRRVLAELCELNRKCDRLDGFLKRDAAKLVSGEETKLMELQYKAMSQYAELLFKRLVLWLEEHDNDKEKEESDAKN